MCVERQLCSRRVEIFRVVCVLVAGVGAVGGGDEDGEKKRTGDDNEEM